MAVTVAVEPKPTLTLDLTAEEAGRIAEAQRQGVDLAALFQGVITRLPPDVSSFSSAAAARRSAVPIALDELEAMEAAVQQDFDNSGMSQDDLGAFVSHLVHRVRNDMNAEGNVPRTNEEADTDARKR